MSNQMAQLQEAIIKAHCKMLRMPMLASQFGSLAEQVIREKQSHIGYLEALLAIELEERERNTIERRIREAHLPRVKTPQEFDYTQFPHVTAAKMRNVAERGYIERAEPVLFIGECGTGKTHLLTGLCVAACRQKRRVRFTTAAGLVNELVEAKHQLQLRRVMARWSRCDLIAIDEVGYVPLAEVGGEFLFQVVAERAEKAAVILTTNLPFSEWTQVIPNARLRMLVSAKPYWIASPTGLTFWRPARNLTASADRLRNTRKEQSQCETGHAVEMTSRWKARKANNRFSILRTALGNRFAIPTSPQHDGHYIYME
jgi:DNA replication protein DnaC